MYRRAWWHGLLAALVCGLAACSAQQMYASCQYLQRAQCYQLADQSKQASCLEHAALPYDEYDRAQKPTP